MGLIIWESARHAAQLTLRDGATVSVATVVPETGSPLLKWKREHANGTWPTDEQAVTVDTLETVQEFDLLQLKSGSVLIGNGDNLFWRTKTSDPQTSGSFEVVTVLA